MSPYNVCVRVCGFVGDESLSCTDETPPGTKPALIFH